MNNIQKNFKAKRGLGMAQGGLIDQLDPSGQMSRMDLGALTNDPDALNAAMDREGLAAEQARQAKYSGQTFMNPVAPPQRQAAPDQQQVSPIQPQQLDRFREPAPTTFEQDNDARGLRIRGYGASMRRTASGFADGGAIDPVEALLARTKAQYGGVAAPQVVAPAPQPQAIAPAPAPQPQKPAGFFGGMKAALDPERRMRAAGLAQGGVARPEFQGPGTGTSDSIPAAVVPTDGRPVTPIRVSDGEVPFIVPAAVADKPKAMNEIENVVAKYNDGKQPNRSLRGNFAVGGPAGEDDLTGRKQLSRTPPVPGANSTPEATALRQTLASPEGNAIRTRLGEQATANATTPRAAVDIRMPPSATSATPVAPPPVAAAPAPMAPPLEIPPTKPAAPQGRLGQVKQAVADGARSVRSMLPGGAPAPAPAAVVEAAPKWYQPSAGVKSLGRVVASGAGSARGLLAPAVLLGGAADAVTGLQAQEGRDVADIQDRGGFVASAAKDAFPGIAAVGENLGNRAGRVVTAVTGGTNPDNGKSESLREALFSADAEGSRVQDFYQRNKGDTPAPAVAAPAVAAPVPAPSLAVPAAAASAAPDTPAAKAANPEDNANIRSLRSAGVTGDVQGDNPAWSNEVVGKFNLGTGPGGEGAGYSQRTGKTGIRTISTTNGDVYAGRDKNGQLNITSGLHRSEAENEALRAKSAEDSKKDLERQSNYFKQASYESDIKSNDPHAIRRGLLAQQGHQAEQKLATEEAKNKADAAHDVGMLDVKKSEAANHARTLDIQTETNRRAAQKDAVEMQTKAVEGADKRAEEYNKQLQTRFRTKGGKDGKEDVADTEGIATYHKVSASTIAQREKETQGTVAHEKWWNKTAKRARTPAELDGTDKENLEGLHEVAKRFKEAGGWMPGEAEKADTSDLEDFSEGVDHGGSIEFPRLSKKFGRTITIQKKDLEYEDGPIGTFSLQNGKTPTDRLMKRIQMRKQERRNS